MSRRSVLTKALIVLALAKEAPGAILRINLIFNFQTTKIAAEVNRLLLKFLLLWQVDI